MWSIVGALILAWFLALFGFDNLIIEGAKELFDVDITMTGYYFIFAVIGILKMLYSSSKR